MGYDCSPALALRELGLRTHAYPFDWVQVFVCQIIECINDDFKHYMTNLSIKDHLPQNSQRMINYYGIEFPHDLPTTINSTGYIGEGLINEDKGSRIVSNWKDYIDIVIQKYNRRVERLKSVLKGNAPVVFVYRGQYARFLLKTIRKSYPQLKCVFVAATPDSVESPDIFTCYPEINGKWNDSDIWKSAILKATSYLETLNNIPNNSHQNTTPYSIFKRKF